MTSPPSVRRTVTTEDPLADQILPAAVYAAQAEGRKLRVMFGGTRAQRYLRSTIRETRRSVLVQIEMKGSDADRDLSIHCRSFTLDAPLEGRTIRKLETGQPVPPDSLDNFATYCAGK